MSVTVVKITEPDSAGSIFNLTSITGTKTPANAAATIFKKIAIAITAPSNGSPNHANATIPITMAHIMPASYTPLTLPTNKIL